MQAQVGILTEAQNNIKQSRSKISYTQKYFWPPKSNVSKSIKPEKINREQLEKWVKNSTREYVKDVHPFQKNIDSFQSEYDIHFQLKKSGSYGVKNLENYAETQNNDAGIRYRLPASGYLAVCKLKVCDKTDVNEMVGIKEAKIHQLGHIFYVPVVSKMFGSVEFSMTFDENGMPQKATMKQPEAPGENLTNALGSVVDNVVAYRTAYEEENKPKTELELVTEQTELLEAQHNLLLAKNQLSPNSSTLFLTDLKTETALAQAQKAYIDALNALNTSPNALEIEQNSSASAMINSETELLKAESARLEAVLAVRNAENALQ